MTRLFSLTFAVLLIVAACGDGTSTVAGGDGGPEPTTTPPDSEPDPTTPSEPEPTPAEPEPPLGAGPYPIADLMFSYEHPDVGTRGYQVVCLGDTATLLGDIDGISDMRACTALAKPDVQARLIDGVPEDQVCTQQYGGPETVRIVGRIDDRPVDTTVDRADGCGIGDWDGLLADLLPEPRPFS